jgi:two-component system KDP operon response regulator KdpE
MDGWEVAARLHEMSDIPIILLTAKTAEADKLRGFRLGVDDYVTKPFSFAELTARIQAVLARAKTSGSAERDLLAFGDLMLDFDRRELRRGGEGITLTPTEYRLLEVLARHQGGAVSEADLMQAIWGTYRQEDTTAVRRYIWLLRKKVEPDPAEPKYVLTVRGYGYRLETG